MNKLRSVIGGFVCLVLIFALAGCNIFSWAHNNEGTSDNAEVQVANANSSLASGDYQKALDSYQAAVNADPKNSEARYGYIKAYIKDLGLDIAEMSKTYSDENKSIAYTVIAFSGQASVKAELIDPDKFLPAKIGGLKKLEELGDKLWEMLGPIAEGQCDGKISAKNPEVNLNLALGYLLKAIFNIADNNHDFVLDYKVRREDDGTITVIDLNGNVITNGSKIIETRSYHGNRGGLSKCVSTDSSPDHYRKTT